MKDLFMKASFMKDVFERRFLGSTKSDRFCIRFKDGIWWNLYLIWCRFPSVEGSRGPRCLLGSKSIHFDRFYKVFSIGFLHLRFTYENQTFFGFSVRDLVFVPSSEPAGWPAGRLAQNLT